MFSTVNFEMSIDKLSQFKQFFFHSLFYFHFSLWMVLFGWELHAFHQKALELQTLNQIGSGIQMGALSVIQTGQEDSPTTGEGMKIASKCGMTKGGGMIKGVMIFHCTPFVNKRLIALED